MGGQTAFLRKRKKHQLLSPPQRAQMQPGTSHHTAAKTVKLQNHKGAGHLGKCTNFIPGRGEPLLYCFLFFCFKQLRHRASAYTGAAHLINQTDVFQGALRLLQNFKGRGLFKARLRSWGRGRTPANSILKDFCWVCNFGKINFIFKTTVTVHSKKYREYAISFLSPKIKPCTPPHCHELSHTMGHFLLQCCGCSPLQPPACKRRVAENPCCIAREVTGPLPNLQPSSATSQGISNSLAFLPEED